CTCSVIRGVSHADHVSPLRQRMLDDRALRNMSPSTQKVYTKLSRTSPVTLIDRRLSVPAKAATQRNRTFGKSPWVPAGAGTNEKRACSNVHAQEPGGVGPEDVAPQRVGNFRRALYEFDRLPFAERIVGAEHDVARINLVGESLQHVGIEDDGLVVE